MPCSIDAAVALVVLEQQVVGEVGEDAPGGVVPEHAVPDRHVRALVHADPGAVGAEGRQAVHDDPRRERHEDRVAVVGPVDGDGDHGARALGLDRDGLSRRAVDAVHVEAQVRAVGDQDPVAGPQDRRIQHEGVANLPARLGLAAGASRARRADVVIGGRRRRRESQEDGCETGGDGSDAHGGPRFGKGPA